MEYRTCNDRFIHATNSGDRYKVEYDSYFDKEGNLCLKEVGKHDMYMDIQADAQSTDINVLIAKYKAGDHSALNRVQGFYTDVSGFPDNIVDVYNLIQDAQDHFESLDPAIKAKFDNTFEKFLFSVGTDEFNEKLGIVPPVEEDVIKEVEDNAE